MFALFSSVAVVGDPWLSHGERVDFGFVCSSDDWNEASPVPASYPAHAHNGVVALNNGARQRAIYINRMTADMTCRKLVVLFLSAINGVGIYFAATLVGPVLRVALVVYGFCSGAVMPLLMLVLMDMRDIDGERMEAAGELYFTIGEIGGFSGPSVVGYIKDSTGSFLPSVVMFSSVTEMMLIPPHP